MTTFADLYHPALGNVHISVPNDPTVLSLYESHGWVLSGGGGPDPTPIDLTVGLGDLRYAKLGDIPTPGTATGDALRAALVPKWKPSTAYASGEFVLNPSGQIVSANTAFTSGTTYNTANWTVVSGGGGAGLPTQSGQGGKFLTTDGTSSSWGLWPTPECRYDIRTWAHCDARWVMDAVMVNASSTITSASAAFTSADVGKLVALATQPASGFATGFSGTITAVNSATSITVSFSQNTGATISGAFLALGSDETSAFQTAINTMIGNTTGGLCYVPDGMYLLGTAPTGNTPQLIIPAMAATAGQIPRTIGFVGQTPPQMNFWNFGLLAAPMTGPIVLGLIGTIGTVGGSILGASSFSHVRLDLKRMTFRTLPGVQKGGVGPGGLALGNLGDVLIQDVSVDVQCTSGANPQPTNFSPGIQMPSEFNGAFCRIERTQVVNYGIGYSLAEHSTLDTCYAVYCRIGYDVVAASHSIYGARMLSQWCAVHLNSSQSTNNARTVVFQELDIEDASSGLWYTTTQHINDPNNTMYGQVNIHRVKAGTQFGDDSNLIFSGARNLQISPLKDAKTSTAGTTAGTAVLSEPFTGAAYKKALVSLAGYQNSGATAQTLTFPIPFSVTPRLVQPTGFGATASTTAITLPTAMGAPVTDWLVAEGF